MIYSIQALRGLAALLVAFGHIPFEALPPILTHLRGAIGVDLFFVTSGFIMAYTTSNRPQGMKSGWHFLLKRLIRIFPIYWIITLTIFLFLTLTHSQLTVETNHLLASLFLIPEQNGSQFISPLIPAGWTLSFEMLFYITFGLLIFFKKKSTFLISLCLLIFIFLGETYPATGPLHALVTAPILLEFIFGLWIYELYSSTPTEKFQKIGMAQLLVGLPLFLLTKDGIQSEYVLTYGNSFIEFGSGEIYPRWFVWGLPSAAVFTGFLTVESFFRKHLKKVSTYLGDISYSLYLLHQGIFAFLTQKLGDLSIWHWMIYLSMALGASTLTFYFVEKPLTKFLRKYLLQRTPD